MLCLCSSHQYTSPLFIVNVVKELIVLQREIQCFYSLLKIVLLFFFLFLIDVLQLRENYNHCFSINCNRRNGCSKDGSFVFRPSQPTSGCRLYSLRPASVTDHVITLFSVTSETFGHEQVCRVPLRPSTSLNNTTSLVSYGDSSSVWRENCALLTGPVTDPD